MANVAWEMPEGMEPGLEASAFYDPPNFVYPFGGPRGRGWRLTSTTGTSSCAATWRWTTAARRSTR